MIKVFMKIMIEIIIYRISQLGPNILSKSYYISMSFATFTEYLLNKNSIGCGIRHFKEFV